MLIVCIYHLYNLFLLNNPIVYFSFGCSDFFMGCFGVSLHLASENVLEMALSCFVHNSVELLVVGDPLLEHTFAPFVF